MAIFVMSLLLLVAVPTASSETAEAACVSASATPPCGYINPQLYLEMPDAASCSLAVIRSANPDLSGCQAPPTDGSPIVMEGTFILTWDISEEGTYLNDPDDPIVVQFQGTSSNPGFIDFALEPSTFSLDSTHLYNPQYYITKDNPDGSSSIWYEYTQPVTLTFSRSGDPTPEDAQRIHNKGGLVQVFIRIHSDASGTTYKDSYGMQVFNFHANSADPSDAAVHDLGTGSRGIPAPSHLFAAAALAMAAVVVRRRNA